MITFLHIFHNRSLEDPFLILHLSISNSSAFCETTCFRFLGNKVPTKITCGLWPLTIPILPWNFTSTTWATQKHPIQRQVLPLSECFSDLRLTMPRAKQGSLGLWANAGRPAKQDVLNAVSESCFYSTPEITSEWYHLFQLPEMLQGKANPTPKWSSKFKTFIKTLESVWIGLVCFGVSRSSNKVRKGALKDDLKINIDQVWPTINIQYCNHILWGI